MPFGSKPDCSRRRCTNLTSSPFAPLANKTFPIMGQRLGPDLSQNLCQSRSGLHDLITLNLSLHLVIASGKRDLIMVVCVFRRVGNPVERLFPEHYRFGG